MAHGSDSIHAKAAARRELLLELVRQGVLVTQALRDPRIGVSYPAYRQWKKRFSACHAGNRFFHCR